MLSRQDWEGGVTRTHLQLVFVGDMRKSTRQQRPGHAEVCECESGTPNVDGAAPEALIPFAFQHLRVRKM